MTWLYILAPLCAVVAVFIAYLSGKRAGEQKAKLKQNVAEIAARQKGDEIIANNNNLGDSELNDWLRKQQARK